MFGFFGKTDMTLPERAGLLLNLVVAGVMTYLNHRLWLTESQRADVIDGYLARIGRKAPALYRGKLSVASTEMVCFLLTSQEEAGVRELFELIGSKPGTRPEAPAAVARMMQECERFLIAKGLHD